VLSDSTEQYDRGLKWEGYQRLDSLTDYVLVSQAKPRIEHFRRDRSNTWLYQIAATGERLTLSNDVVLDIDAIFAGVLVLPGD
jgi:Uma2 family endonuclease